MAQAPIIKNNFLRFMDGKDCNAVYNGYSYQSLILGADKATGFSHLHDFEPTATNHWSPNFGLPATFYFHYTLSRSHSKSIKYSSFEKTHGPPYNRWAQEFDELEHNEYLNAHGIEAEDVRHPDAQARLEGKGVSTE